MELGFREVWIRAKENDRRRADANWFELLGSVGDTDEDVFKVLEHTADANKPLQPPRMGEIFLFTNDLCSKYDNNSGLMKVTIRRTK